STQAAAPPGWSVGGYAGRATRFHDAGTDRSATPRVPLSGVVGPADYRRSGPGLPTREKNVCLTN
ncbi:MAG: hypothetical protein M3140_09025, partial [Actinomycetota bacterium]|nr:hypothetical protein [Actinomycetota bacterium]